MTWGSVATTAGTAASNYTGTGGNDMTWGSVAIGAGTALAGIYGAQQQASSQQSANEANAAMWREQQADRQRREAEANRLAQEQFGAYKSEMMPRLNPYIQAGQSALGQQSALLGLSGAEAQQQALQAFGESPGQQFLRDRQEKALLRSVSKIGGLGGGNVRSALQEQAYGRAQTGLSEQLARLGAVTGQGQQAVGQLGAIGAGPGYQQVAG